MKNESIARSPGWFLPSSFSLGPLDGLHHPRTNRFRGAPAAIGRADEAVNAYIIGQLLSGESFHYDPRDRHGPVLYLLAKPIVQLCGAKNFAGLTETQVRLAPVIAGSVTVLLFGAAVEMFGFITCLIAALLFVFAPLPVYYSRYFIHESLFVADVRLPGNRPTNGTRHGRGILRNRCRSQDAASEAAVELIEGTILHPLRERKTRVRSGGHRQGIYTRPHGGSCSRVGMPGVPARRGRQQHSGRRRSR